MKRATSVYIIAMTVSDCVWNLQKVCQKILENNHKNILSTGPQSRIDLSGIEVSAVYLRSETHEKSACAFVDEI